jgi:hypothetical protein
MQAKHQRAILHASVNDKVWHFHMTVTKNQYEKRHHKNLQPKKSAPKKSANFQAKIVVVFSSAPPNEFEVARALAFHIAFLRNDVGVNPRDVLLQQVVVVGAGRRVSARVCARPKVKGRCIARRKTEYV